MKGVLGILVSGLAAPGMPMPPPPMAPPPTKSGMGTVSGVMYILGAVFLIITLIGGILAAAVGSIIGGALNSDEVNKVVAYIWGVCVALPLLGLIFGILGAIFVFKRRNFMVAMVGGILGMVAGILSGVLFIGGDVSMNYVSILAFIFFLIGLLMQVMVKKEFTS